MLTSASTNPRGPADRGPASRGPASRLARALRPVLASRAVRVIALLLLCAAYLQGGLVKLTDFPGALAEMNHFGLRPAPLFAVAVIVLQLGACAMILSGRLRWLGALALAVFTVLATGLALRYWKLPVGPARAAAAISFFEHLGLVGGLLLLAGLDLQERRA